MPGLCISKQLQEAPVNNSKPIDEVQIEDDLINKYSLETLLVMLALTKEGTENQKIADELKKMHDNYDKINFLQKVLENINKATNDKGDLNISKNSDLQDLLKQAKEDYGIIIDLDKKKYNDSERERLVENFNKRINTINNDISLSLITLPHLQNMLTEAFSSARKGAQSQHDSKTQLTRNIKGG